MSTYHFPLHMKKTDVCFRNLFPTTYIYKSIHLYKKYVAKVKK